MDKVAVETKLLVPLSKVVLYVLLTSTKVAPSTLWAWLKEFTQCKTRKIHCKKAPFRKVQSAVSRSITTTAPNTADAIESIRKGPTSKCLSTEKKKRARSPHATTLSGTLSTLPRRPKGQ